MGRLQRKKISSTKKKKKQSTDTSASTDTAVNSSTKPKVLSGVSLLKTKKIQSSSWKKNLADQKQASGKKKTSFLDTGLQFLREVKIELKKVTWPSRKQTMSSTVVMIILVIIIAFFLGVVDIGLSGLVRLVLK